MIVRRNTKTFRALQNVFERFASKRDRQKSLKLYALRSGEKLAQKVDLSALKNEQRDFYYNLNYEAIRENFRTAGKTLHQSDRNKHLYYFQGLHEETPFELKGKLQKTFRLYGRKRAAEKEKPAARKSAVRKDRSPRAKKEIRPRRRKKISS